MRCRRPVSSCQSCFAPLLNTSLTQGSVAKINDGKRPCLGILVVNGLRSAESSIRDGFAEAKRMGS